MFGKRFWSPKGEEIDRGSSDVREASTMEPTLGVSPLARSTGDAHPSTTANNGGLTKTVRIFPCFNRV